MPSNRRPFEKAIRVPDDDPRLKGAGPGECQLSDCRRFMYVRDSDWLSFLSELSINLVKRANLQDDETLYG